MTRRELFGAFLVAPFIPKVEKSVKTYFGTKTFEGPVTFNGPVRIAHDGRYYTVPMTITNTEYMGFGYREWPKGTPLQEKK